MNKVTTDFAMGIADKDLSEELQVQSEQPWEVECKCLASHPSAGGPGADRSPQDPQEPAQTVGQAKKAARAGGSAEPRDKPS